MTAKHTNTRIYHEEEEEEGGGEGRGERMKERIMHSLPYSGAIDI
jgi:hypothetical protein